MEDGKIKNVMRRIAWVAVLAAVCHSSVAPAAEQDVAAAVAANNAFAFDLYKQLAKENEGENLFFSPYSVSSAPEMTAEGARGQRFHVERRRLTRAAEIAQHARQRHSAGRFEELTPFHLMISVFEFIGTVSVTVSRK